jgi:phosphate/phosphite/phosphonate ABC transporter binding protein
VAISKSEPRVAAPQVSALPIPRRIGRYEVIDRLATGGMAEVFICCERGMAGLERLVVVKRILPHLAVHGAFVDMFLAEARYVARLNHPNVVQIYELGEHTGAEGPPSPYLAMEYVAGSSLRDVLIAAIEKGVDTPVGAGVGLIAQACAGAHAAHELTDAAGKALGLVHRDISPHNLMVTGEGHVKLLDFGIAKATELADVDDHTRTGALKGKVHYMAPEQCKQEPLDRRADVFALGIVLWELLAQERLFKRESDLDSMQAIVTADLKDLRKFRKDIPAGVVAAVEKALRRDKNERYATADEMRKALVDACAAEGVRCDLDAVASFVKPLIGDVHAQRSAQLISLAQEKTRATPAADAVISDDATLVDKRVGKNAAGEGAAELEVTATDKRPRAAREAALRERPPSTVKPTPGTAVPVRRRRAVVQAAAIGLVVGLFIAGGFVVRKYILDAPTGPPLTVAFPSTADRGLVIADLAPLRTYLEEKLHRPVEIDVPDSYEALLDRFLAGQVAVAVLPPNTYVQAKKREPRIELIAQKIIDGASGSDGVIFVHETSKVQSIADLKGRRFCYPDPLSTTGWVLARKALKQAGVDPDKDVIAHISGNHINVLRDIVTGVCEAGATYSGGYLAADRAGVPVAQVKLLANTGRSPQDAICTGPSVSAQDRKRIQDALLSYDPKELGVIGGRVERISGFARTIDGDYDGIRDVQ